MVPRGLGRRVDKALIQRVTRLALERDRWEKPATLDVHIVDDDEMREINGSRRGVEEVTDVLSFPLFELEPGAGIRQDFFVLPPDEQVHIGDVVISFPRVAAQAEEAGHSPEREIAFLTVHGVLHLLGYDHETVPDRRRMRRREEEVLAEMGLRRNGARGSASPKV
jgi:probable rRNA maturation factor